MSKESSFALGVGATVVGGLALVLAIRALIPGADPEPQSLRTDAVERSSSDPGDDGSSPNAAAPAIIAPEAAAPIAQPEASANAVEPPTPPRPVEPELSDASSASSTTLSLLSSDAGPPGAAPGPIVPVEVLRADFDRVRARYEAAASGDAGGARSPESRRAMIALMEGSALLRRLSAGDPTFHDQLNAYRNAVSSGGSLDENARAALRARMFDSAYGDRAALYDEILRALR